MKTQTYWLGHSRLVVSSGVDFVLIPLVLAFGVSLAVTIAIIVLKGVSEAAGPADGMGGALLFAVLGTPIAFVVGALVGLALLGQRLLEDILYFWQRRSLVDEFPSL